MEQKSVLNIGQLIPQTALQLREYESPYFTETEGPTVSKSENVPISGPQNTFQQGEVASSSRKAQGNHILGPTAFASGRGWEAQCCAFPSSLLSRSHPSPLEDDG